MRLIDAEVLILETLFNPNHVSYISRQDVQNAPTVDAEPVTRCKDCRWYDAGHNEVDAWQRCRVLKIETHDDFFCANGERADVQRV